jgi:hypothetical protein
MAAQTILDRSVAMRVLPSAIFTADTFAKSVILQKPIGDVSLSLLVISKHKGKRACAIVHSYRFPLRADLYPCIH